MADKDVDGLIDALAAADALHKTGTTVIATSVDAARALPADELARRWRQRVPYLHDVRAIDNPIAAVEAAIARPGITVVAGSLYLVGAVRAHLVDDPALRDPEPGVPAP
jgi:folylpolyglutamate synthase/dihydropteroate synthase